MNKKKQGICNLCGQEKLFCKAHIIPESFYKEFSRERGKLVIVDKDCNYTKRTPIGIYDETILCRECDGDILGGLDEYGKCFFYKKVFTKFCKNNECLFYLKKEEYDFVKLRKFLISVLWRASISENDFFNTVSLKKYQDIAKQIISTDTVIYENYFNIRIYYFEKLPLECFHPIDMIRDSKQQIVYRILFNHFLVEIRPKSTGIYNEIFNENKILIGIQKELSFNGYFKSEY